jgi:hypothetical protein
MEAKHLKAIATKCSKQKRPTIPSFPSISSSPSAKKNHANANFVTPPPNSLAAKATQAREGNSKNDDGSAEITPLASASRNPKKPSAGALAMHKKWQEAAEAIGGKDARIVVSKPVAKKLVFDLLFDAFRPMNITDIYKVIATFQIDVNLQIPVAHWKLLYV